MTPINDLSHALKLMRPYYHLRHVELNDDIEAKRLTPQEAGRQSRQLTLIMRRLELAARGQKDDLPPGYRFSDAALLECLDEQIERLITLDAVTIRDIEALAQVRGLFAEEPGIDLHVDLAGLSQLHGETSP